MSSPRFRCPFLPAPAVPVTSPSLIRSLSAHPSFLRAAGHPLPPLVRFWFPSTKFYMPATDQFFLGMVSTDDPSYAPRIAAVREKLAGGFSDQQVTRLGELIHSDMSLEQVAVECCKLVAELLLPGVHMPDDIARDAFGTATTPAVVWKPWAYAQCRKRRRRVEEFVKKVKPEEKYVVDVAHNLGAAAQGMSTAVVRLRKGEKGEGVEKRLQRAPVVEGVMRVCCKEEVVDGLGKVGKGSVVRLMLGDAEKKEGNGMFLFGTGVEERQCPFRGLFLHAAGKAIADREEKGV